MFLDTPPALRWSGEQKEGLGLSCVVHHRPQKLLYKCCYIKCEAAANISIPQPLSHSKCVCQLSWVFLGDLKITVLIKLSETTAGAALGRVCHKLCGLASSKHLWPWEDLGSSHPKASEGVTNPSLFWKRSTGELSDIWVHRKSCAERAFLN